MKAAVAHLPSRLARRRAGVVKLDLFFVGRVIG